MTSERSLRILVVALSVAVLLLFVAYAWVKTEPSAITRRCFYYGREIDCNTVIYNRQGSFPLPQLPINFTVGDL